MFEADAIEDIRRIRKGDPPDMLHALKTVANEYDLHMGYLGFRQLAIDKILCCGNPALNAILLSTDRDTAKLVTIAIKYIVRHQS